MNELEQISTTCISEINKKLCELRADINIVEVKHLEEADITVFDADQIKSSDYTIVHYASGKYNLYYSFIKDMSKSTETKSVYYGMLATDEDSLHSDYEYENADFTMSISTTTKTEVFSKKVNNIAAFILKELNKVIEYEKERLAYLNKINETMAKAEQN